MRTEIEALKEIRDRISYFCSKTDGKYDPPWAEEVIGIIDDVLITPYRQCKRFGAPFYVDVGTSIVAIRCASNHDVVWRADHSVHGKATVDWAESMCTRMNQEAHRQGLSKNASKNGADFGQLGDAAKLREALKHIKDRLPHMLQYMRVHWEDASAGGYFDELMLVINAALATPPRNCDLPEVAKDPWRAWLDDKSNWEEGYPKLEIHDWLFATATEQKGESDGSK